LGFCLAVIVCIGSWVITAQEEVGVLSRLKTVSKSLNLLYISKYFQRSIIESQSIMVFLKFSVFLGIAGFILLLLVLIVMIVADIVLIVAAMKVSSL